MLDDLLAITGNPRQTAATQLQQLVEYLRGAALARELAAEFLLDRQLLKVLSGGYQVELKAAVDLGADQAVDRQGFGRLDGKVLAGLIAAVEGQGDAEVALCLGLDMQDTRLDQAAGRKLGGIETGQGRGGLPAARAETEAWSAKRGQGQHLAGGERLTGLCLDTGLPAVRHLQFEQHAE